MPLHSYNAFDSIISDAINRGDHSLAGEYIALKLPFFFTNTNATLSVFLETQKNKAVFYPIIDKALSDQEYLSEPERNRPWKLIVMFIIHMSTLKGNITLADKHKLDRLIADLPENCKTVVVGKLENDQEIARLFKAAITDLAEKNEKIPAYLKTINEILLNPKLELTKIWKDTAKAPEESGSQHDETSEFTDISASSNLSSLTDRDYLEMIEKNAMSNADWVALTKELILEDQDIIHNKPLMKTLAQHYKKNMLDAIRNDETLQESLNKAVKTSNQESIVRTADGKNIRTNHALLSLFSTTKRSSTTRAFGKTKSAIELCSIMKWSTGVRRKPSSYLNIENNNDELLTLLINKMDSITANKLKEWLHDVHLWEEPLPLKLHIILLTLTQKDGLFKEKTDVIDMLLDKKVFNVDAFITHLLTLTKKPENWPDLQTILPLTAYLLGKTKAQDLSKDNLQHLSHREFKQPFLFAFKSHYDTFSDLVDSKQPNALNAVIDFHQWKPTLFTTKTKTRARVEALKIKNEPPKAT